MSFQNRNEGLKKFRDAAPKVPNWAIAEALNCHENTLLRWLRQELPEAKKQQILNVITELKAELEHVKG